MDEALLEEDEILPERKDDWQEVTNYKSIEPSYCRFGNPPDLLEIDSENPPDSIE